MTEKKQKPQAGKGSKRRRGEDTSAFDRGYERIRWKSGRKR